MALVTAGPVQRLKYFWTQTGNRRRMTRELSALLRPMSGLVLDIGGGRSAPHDVAYQAGVTRLRIDISPTHGPHVVGRAEQLPIRDGAVDNVVMAEVLEHIEDAPGAVSEVARVLKDGGTFAGAVPFLMRVHGDPHDYARYTESGLRRLLGPFHDVRITPHGNAWSSAWTLLASTSRVLRLLNPVLRSIGDRSDPIAPEGYCFTATRRSAGR